MAAYWIATTVVNCASFAYACDPHFKLQNEHREITALMATFSAELGFKVLEKEISDAANNIRLVKEELFQKRWGEEPIIVSLDQRGRIVHPNVIHMMLTWSPDYIQQNTIGVKVIPHNITLFIQNELKQGVYGIEASSESSNFRHNVGPKIDSMTTDLVHNIADKINDWKMGVERIIEEMTAQSSPYDSEKEKLLWQQQTWTLHLLAPQSYNHYYTIGMPINDWARMQQLKDGCY
nr:protein SIEVE ELEMENT OCCLUSION B-like [Ipomoea batatas]